MKQALLLLVGFAAGIVVGWLIAPRGEGPAASQPTEVARETEPEPVPEPPRREATPVPEPVPTREAASLGGGPDEPEVEQAPPGPRVTADGRVQVQVVLRLPDGGQPQEGIVRWAPTPDTPRNRMHWTTWKAPARGIYVQQGDVWIHGFGGLREGSKSEPRHLRVRADEPLVEVILVLRERTGVHGKVVLPGKFDRPRLEVRLRPLEGDTPAAEAPFDRSDRSAQPRARDGYGFAFHDLEPGTYALGLSFGRERFRVVETVQVTEGMVEQDLVVDRFDPKHFMEIKVLGPDGQPIPDAQVAITFSGGNRSVAGGNIALQREDGVFIVDHIPEHTLGEDGEYAEGVYAVRVHTQEHGEILRPYDPRSTESLTIRVAEEESFSIRLLDYADSPAAGKLKASARPVGETGIRNPRAVGPDGVVDFGQLQPGSYEIVLMVTKPRTVPVAIYPLEVAPGDDIHELPTPVFHRLVLRFAKDAEDPVFSLRRTFGTSTWSMGWATEDEPGKLVFEDLTEGSYSLEGHVGERWVKREVHVPAESVIRLD